MTISSEITKLINNLAACYTKCTNKGATIPQDENFDNLADCINSIPTANLTSLSVTPSTTAQTLTPSSPYNGFNQVDVSAINLQSKYVTIDSPYPTPITPDSGYDGLSSVGVTLNNENLIVTPSTSYQNLSPSSGHSGFGNISVNAVTAAIDSNITAGNIKSGVKILGVRGTLSGLNGTTTSITPTTSSQTVTPDSPYNGFTSVTVPAVTSSIDANITAGNIKKDVQILGVTGTYEGSGGSSIDIPREISANGTFQMPSSNFTFSLPSNAADIGDYALNYAFNNCTSLTSVDLSNLTTVSGLRAMQYAFYNCTNLTSVDLSSLTTISGSNTMSNAFYGCTNLTNVDLSSLTNLRGESAMNNAFYGCTSLTSLDLSSLTTISGSNAMSNTFQACTGLTSLDLSSLTTVSGNNAMSNTFQACTGLTSVLFTNLETIGTNSSAAEYGHFTQCFNACISLTSITFPKLEKIYCTGANATYGTFANNNKVQKLYFPKLDTITYGSGATAPYQTACKNIFYGCSTLTELHFAAANKTAIEASSGYSTAWGRGAGNVTIYFDL